MYYIYDDFHLAPVRQNAEDAIALAGFTDTVLVTNKIDEAAQIAHYPKSAFLIHAKNSMSLFGFWKYQLRYRTMKEFRIILYAAPENLLYRILACAAWFSFGRYRIIPYYRKKR